MRQAVAIVVLFMFVAASVWGQQTGSAAKPAGTFLGEFLWQLDDVEKKAVSLAEAMPMEKYGWRPAEGVRSVSEVFVHIAVSNYMIPSLVGAKVPEGITRDMETKVTAKGEVIPLLKKSFAFVRETAAGLSSEDLAKQVRMFGRETSALGVYFLAANHMHEHLGQMISYARMNGVTPSWTAERMRNSKN